MGLIAVSERDLQRIEILSKVIAGRMMMSAGRAKRRFRNNASSSEFA
ncbi:hypothetical protein [Rhizobium leguminosarum]